MKSVFRLNKATNQWVVMAEGRSGRPHQYADEEGDGAEAWPSHDPACPFCVGNEAQTGAASLACDIRGSMHDCDVPPLERGTPLPQCDWGEAHGIAAAARGAAAGTAASRGRRERGSHTGADAPADHHGGTEGGVGPWQVRVVQNKFPVVSEAMPRPDPATLSDPLNYPAQICGFGDHEVVVESPLHHAPLSERSDVAVEAMVRAWVSRGRAMREHDAISHVTAFKNQGRRAGGAYVCCVFVVWAQGAVPSR